MRIRRLGSSSSRARIVAIAASVVFVLGIVAPANAGKPASGGSGGKGKRDTSPPTVSIASPSAGSTVSGTITVSGTSADNAGVSAVAVRIDGGAAQAASGSTSWSRSIDTSAYANGAHTITATATDTSGNAGTASVTIDVNNGAPSPSPTPTTSPTPSPNATPTGSPVAAPALQPGSIGGWTFKDLNRNGVYETTDEPFANHHLYLFSASGSYLGQAYSDASGWYVFTGRADGDYRVEYDSSTWAPMKHDWVPTTTGTAWPKRTVNLAGTARADFGWRTITWSSDLNAPVASYTAPNGMRVQAYNDAVAPSTVYDMATTGLVGSEAGTVTIRFGWGTVSATSTSVVRVGGVYQDFAASVYVSYDAWLETAGFTLGHEYGHAWSWYYAFIVQQDETMAGYLSARGLSGDSRVGSSYEWGVGEMIAEDYRQLLGPPAGRSTPQANTAIPPASQVPGLAEYLSSVFTQPA